MVCDQSTLIIRTHELPGNDGSADELHNRLLRALCLGHMCCSYFCSVGVNGLEK